MKCEHLDKLNESYWEHLKIALSYSLVFFVAALTSLIHAFIPWVFCKTPSAIVKRVSEDIERRTEI